MDDMTTVDDEEDTESNTQVNSPTFYLLINRSICRAIDRPVNHFILGKTPYRKKHTDDRTIIMNGRVNCRLNCKSSAENRRRPI